MLSLVGLLSLVGCTLTPRALSPSEHAAMLIAEYGEVHVQTCATTIERLARKATPSEHQTPRILVLDTETPLALSPTPGLLVLSKGMLLLLPTEAEAFFIIAHEIGHAELGHHRSSSTDIPSKSSSFIRELELAADTYALKHLLSAGYPLTAAVTALQRADVAATNGATQDGRISDYPSLNERTQSLVQLSPALLAEQRKAPLASLEHRDYQECRGALKTSSALRSAF